MDKREILLSPLKIGSHTSQNRFFIQPMECNDGDKDGNPTDLTYQRYEKLFQGEAGLVSLEAITITDKNRSRMNQLFIMPQNQARPGKIRPPHARGEPKDALHLPAHPFRRAEQSGIFQKTLGETSAGLHGGCVHRG